jgi:dGTPase
LEGIAKHNGPVLGDLPYALAEYDAQHDLELATHASAEAQVAALSDDIAYNNHDMHDGLRAGLFTDDDVAALPMVGAAYAEVDTKYPGLDLHKRRHEALRRVFGVMVSDVIVTSRGLLAHSGVSSVEDVRHLGRPVIGFSDKLWDDLQVIRKFLFTQMYRAPSVMEKRAEVTQVIHALFPLFLNDPAQLPAEWQAELTGADKTAIARRVSDYISGMTDRFALQEHARIFAND